MMTCRLLDVDSEWPLIEHEFTSRGTTLPDPHFSQIMGAFDDQTPPTLQGFLVCQLQFHFEPLVLYSPHALRGLVRSMEETLTAELGPGVRYFAFADTPEIKGICAATGMQPVSSSLFTKALCPAKPDMVE